MLNVMVDNTKFHLIIKTFILKQYLSNLNCTNYKTDWKLAYADKVSILTVSYCKKNNLLEKLSFIFLGYCWQSLMNSNKPFKHGWVSERHSDKMTRCVTLARRVTLAQQQKDTVCQLDTATKWHGPSLWHGGSLWHSDKMFKLYFFF